MATLDMSKAISETVQDTASDTVWPIGNHIRRIQWYHSGSSGVTPDKDYGHPI